jgi:large exoprotein involved in heme utilization and adhesion
MHGSILMADESLATIVTSQTLNSSGNTGKVTASAPEGDIVLDGPGIFTHTQGSGGAGQVEITAKNLIMNSGFLGQANLAALQPDGLTVTLSGNLTMASNSFMLTSSAGESSFGPGGPAADINLTAKDIVVSQGSLINSSTFGSGAGGHISIVADTLHINEGSQIVSGATEALGEIPQADITGPGGEITIRGQTGSATSVTIDGASSGIFTNTVGTGPGGNANIAAKSVTIQNGGTISAETSGTASSATGGNILFSSSQLGINNGGSITASTSGPAKAGTVNVQAIPGSASSIIIDGADSGIRTETSGTGAGGNINVSSQSLTIQNGGILSAATSGTAASATGGIITVNANQIQVNNGGLITASTTGAGAGGSVNINANNIFSSNAGTVSSTAVQSTGGNINIEAGQSLNLTNGASISASSTGAGNAGNININAGNQLAMNSSSVTTEANQASGGAIKITTTPGGTVELTDSVITASVLDGTGGGGSVDIDPQFVILQNSQILANSVFGPGGNISITTNLLLPDTTSVISASSQFGQQGNIVIQSPVSPASGKIIPLGQKPLIATALVSQRCAALAGGNASSFTIAGRDSLPAEPGGWVPSPLALSLAESNEGTATETGLSSFSEMEKESPLLSLRKVAPAGFLTQSFGAASSDCQS